MTPADPTPRLLADDEMANLRRAVEAGFMLSEREQCALLSHAADR